MRPTFTIKRWLLSKICMREERRAIHLISVTYWTWGKVTQRSMRDWCLKERRIIMNTTVGWARASKALLQIQDDQTLLEVWPMKRAGILGWRENQVPMGYRIRKSSTIIEGNLAWNNKTNLDISVSTKESPMEAQASISILAISSSSNFSSVKTMLKILEELK